MEGGGGIEEINLFGQLICWLIMSAARTLLPFDSNNQGENINIDGSYCIITVDCFCTA